jgi:hypothetical protein
MSISARNPTSGVTMTDANANEVLEREKLRYEVDKLQIEVA